MPRKMTPCPTAPVSALTNNSWNPNVMADWMYEKERASIRKYGFVSPIVVAPLGKTGKWEIVDGEHRLKVARELGYTEVPIFNIGNVPRSVRMQITIALNRLHGQDDQHKLAAIFTELEADLGRESLLEALPFTDQDIDALMGTLETHAPPPAEPSTPSPMKAPQYHLLITVATESEQKTLCEKLVKDGLQCRVLT